MRRKGQQAENDKTERVTGLGRRTRGDSKVESNDSPEIPDRGETSDIPGLPSEALKIAKQFFCMTLHLMITHHHTNFDYKRLCSSGDIV